MTEWTPHNGGPCPVDPAAIIQVKFRNGLISEAGGAAVLDWSHGGFGSDITAYRLLPPEPNWREIADELAAALKRLSCFAVLMPMPKGPPS